MINSPLDDYAFERPRMYDRRPPVPLEPVSTSPLPNEIVSAVSLLKDYMKEGDAAIEKHKSKNEKETEKGNRTKIETPKSTEQNKSIIADSKVAAASTTTTSTSAS